MGTLINFTAHGLLASDTIVLGNLVGGEGLTENLLYYVLAAGLTANAFAVGLTDGGAAVVFTTDITSGVVTRSDTYEVVTDGVMNPPDVPDPLAAPFVSSEAISGIVRLLVTL